MKFRLRSLLAPFEIHSDSPIGAVKIPKRASRDPEVIEARLDEIFDGRPVVRIFLEDTGVPIKSVVFGADARGYEKYDVEGGIGASVHVWKLKS